VLLTLLATGLWPAAASAVDGDGEITFAVPLQAAHGLSVKLEADDDEVELTVRKRAEEAVYIGHGEVSRDGFSANFGEFGEFTLAYEPIRTLETHGPNRHCEGEPKTTTEGYFRGTLHFRGERGYVDVEATRAKGTLVLVPPWRCHYGSARASRAREREKRRRVATLVAASRGNPVSFVAFGSREEREKPFAAFYATSQEVRDGVGIVRLTWAVVGGHAGFVFDNPGGTAFVDPPAPFAGSAGYLRRPNARDRWAGNLTAPLLGLGRVHLTGPGFDARMVPRLPAFE
jgi:hypothetical protein